MNRKPTTTDKNKRRINEVKSEKNCISREKGMNGNSTLSSESDTQIMKTFVSVNPKLEIAKSLSNAY